MLSSFAFVPPRGAVAGAPLAQAPRTPLAAPERYRLGAIFPTLVAVADDTAAESAIRFTNALARERGAIPTVLRVLDVSVYAALDSLPSVGSVEAAMLSPEYRDEVVASLEERIRSVLGAPSRWRIEFEAGETGFCIAREARRLRAELIVVGLRPHSALRRAFVRDTVCDVIRGASAPVIAACPTMRGLPSRIMVALDFSPASIRAAHLARELVGYTGSIELVYVRPQGDGAGSARLEETLERMIEELEPTRDVQVTSTVLDGEPAIRLLKHAAAIQPDLVAMGHGRHNVVDRFFNDSVSTTFAHDARWSLLVVPEVTG